MQWSWDRDEINSQNWVVENSDGTYESYAQIEIMPLKIRNGDLLECGATNKVMWLAAEAPYIVNTTLIVQCE